jgi:hypothetical protein
MLGTSSKPELQFNAVMGAGNPSLMEMMKKKDE